MRRDFEKFFTKLQLDFNNISKQKEQIDKEFGQGLLTDQQYANFIKYYESIKINYDRVNYVRYLLHKPPKFIEDILTKITTKTTKKEVEKILEQKDTTLEENSTILENVAQEFTKDE